MNRQTRRANHRHYKGTVLNSINEAKNFLAKRGIEVIARNKFGISIDDATDNEIVWVMHREFGIRIKAQKNDKKED
jgi:hypothetical protein